MKKQQHIFKFIKYIKPIWYYNLKSDFSYYTWVSQNQVSVKILSHFDLSDVFTSTQSQAADFAWQAWQKGILVKKEDQKELSFTALPIVDEYRFIARYFSRLWLFYILLIRLLSFKNPFVEIGGFFRALSIRRINPSDNIPPNDEIKNYNCHLLNRKPLVTVVIPTLNRYQYLKDVLKDLEKQSYKHFEVLVCDQSDPYEEAFYKGYNLDLRVFKQQEKALWLARNRCIKESKGELILLFDDDSRVGDDWIEMHIRCLDFFNADISAGISISTQGAKVPANYNCYRWSDQLDTGNAMLYKCIFETTGLFDRQFEKMRMGDGEFGLRAYLNGFVNINNPDACRLHLKVGTGGLRHMGSWDAFRTQKLFAPRPVPSVLYLSRKYFGTRSSLRWLLINIPPSLIPYRFKSNTLLSILGSFIALLLFPIFMIQINISWKLSSKMLKQGAKIDKLKIQS